MAEVHIPNSVGENIDSELTEFCKRWKISELALFGSALRDDFGQNSDIDLLISFMPNTEWSLLDHFQMEEELCSLFDQRVDLVSKRAIERSENWIRRKTILESAQVLYAA